MHPALASLLIWTAWGLGFWGLVLKPGLPQNGMGILLPFPVIGLVLYLVSAWVYRRQGQLLLLFWSIVSTIVAGYVNDFVGYFWRYFVQGRPPVPEGWSIQQDLLETVELMGDLGFWLIVLFIYVNHLAVRYVHNRRRANGWSTRHPSKPTSQEETELAEKSPT